MLRAHAPASVAKKKKKERGYVVRRKVKSPPMDIIPNTHQVAYYIYRIPSMYTGVYIYEEE